MNLRISVGADENCVKDESRNTGDADLKLLLLAVAEVEPDDDVRLCERSADLCGSHNRRRSARLETASRGRVAATQLCDYSSASGQPIRHQRASPDAQGDAGGPGPMMSMSSPVVGSLALSSYTGWRGQRRDRPVRNVWDVARAAASRYERVGASNLTPCASRDEADGRRRYLRRDDAAAGVPVSTSTRSCSRGPRTRRPAHCCQRCPGVCNDSARCRSDVLGASVVRVSTAAPHLSVTGSTASIHRCRGARPACEVGGRLPLGPVGRPSVAVVGEKHERRGFARDRRAGACSDVHVAVEVYLRRLNG